MKRLAWLAIVSFVLYGCGGSGPSPQSSPTAPSSVDAGGGAPVTYTTETLTGSAGVGLDCSPTYGCTGAYLTYTFTFTESGIFTATVQYDGIPNGIGMYLYKDKTFVASSNYADTFSADVQSGTYTLDVWSTDTNRIGGVPVTLTVKHPN